jgi:hypothetical protein
MRIKFTGLTGIRNAVFLSENTKVITHGRLIGFAKVVLIIVPLLKTYLGSFLTQNVRFPGFTNASSIGWIKDY